MAINWSYSGDPADNVIDKVRFILGDTIEADPQLSDPEIRMLIDDFGEGYKAAIPGARAIAAKYSRLVETVTGEEEAKWNQLFLHYKDLADELEAQIAKRGKNVPLPFAGGISRQDVCNRRADTDRIPGEFQSNQDKNLRFDGTANLNFRDIKDTGCCPTSQTSGGTE